MRSATTSSRGRSTHRPGGARRRRARRGRARAPPRRAGRSCLLAPPPRGTGRAAIERAAALAYLRAHGAALAHDVDAWLEAVVLLVRFGLPRGPRAAVIAPPGSWLEAQATRDRRRGRARRRALAAVARADDPTDVVLYDPALGAPPAIHARPPRPGRRARRARRRRRRIALYGARAALGAIAILGRAAERIAVGLGPAPRAASAELAIDRERARAPARASSASERAARRSRDQGPALGVRRPDHAPGRRDDAVGRGQARAPRRLPRRAQAVGPRPPDRAGGLPRRARRHERRARAPRVRRGARRRRHARPTEGTAVIVRETPPAGRDVSVSFARASRRSAGPSCSTRRAPADRRGPRPAPADRRADARRPGRRVARRRSRPRSHAASRTCCAAPRTSSSISTTGSPRLELPRVVVGGRGARTLVVDACGRAAVAPAAHLRCFQDRGFRWRR